MAYFKISYGCGCGEEKEYIEAKDFDDAYKTAYNLAVEKYESYAGFHGILSESEIADEEFGVNLEDAEDANEDILKQINERYCEEIENTISYDAEEVSEEEYWSETDL